MLDELKQRVTMMLSRVEVAPDRRCHRRRSMQSFMELHPEPEGGFGGEPEMALEMAGAGPPRAWRWPPSRCTPKRWTRTIPRTWRSVGRNAPCPCGSGRKYKHCHGRLG